LKEITLEDGSKRSNFMEIKEASKSHFETLYTENEGVDPKITASTLEHIPEVVTQRENTE
jgi:hypothetical protein